MTSPLSHKESSSYCVLAKESAFTLPHSPMLPLSAAGSSSGDDPRGHVVHSFLAAVSALRHPELRETTREVCGELHKDGEIEGLSLHRVSANCGCNPPGALLPNVLTVHSEHRLSSYFTPGTELSSGTTQSSYMHFLGNI